jgi:glutamyl/glutaminyl-tRNA synthetase
MSKRDQGASLSTYLEEGYVPEAVLNYLCLLGWSPKGNREKVSRQEVVEMFDLPQILRANARFDLTKLRWLNAEYIRELSADRFHELAVHALTKAGIATEQFPVEYVKAALDTCQEKIKLLPDLPPFAEFYFKEEVEIDPEAIKKDFTPENKPRLLKWREALSKLAAFDASTLGSTLQNVAAELGVKAGVLVHPTRLACTGKTIGPSLYHLMEVLGKERVLKRLDRALALIP